MEMVNHPNHYNKSGRKECIVELEDMFGPKFVADFCYANALKYLYRDGGKEGNSAKQDYDKAKWYFDYVDEVLAPKYKTPAFNLKARGVVEKKLKNARRKFRLEAKGE